MKRAPRQTKRERKGKARASKMSAEEQRLAAEAYNREREAALERWEAQRKATEKALEEGRTSPPRGATRIMLTLSSVLGFGSVVLPRDVR